MYLIIRFAVWVYWLIACKVFRFHSYKNERIRFARQVEMIPRMTRIVLRYRDQRCRLCGKTRTLVDRARVAHDWQYPERLFPAP